MADPLMNYLRLVDRSWPLLRRLMRVHVALYQVTGGRIGPRMPGLPPMLLLHHVGAKTGERYTTPLVYMEDGEDFVVVGSKGGYPQHPGWVHNLRKTPNTEIQVGSGRIPVHASEASEAERRRLWPRAIAHNPRWGRYQERTEREIPIVVLRRRRA
jgi:F420H(2)-dependent quinone reductase